LAAYLRAARDEQNPTGWRLYGVKKVNEKAMYPEKYQNLESEIFE
jgi:hypothetical protein